MSAPLIIHSTVAAQTAAIGIALGRQAEPGELIALCGELGAGKTQFVQGLAAGLEVPDGEPVVSPTFVLIREYSGRLKLFHLDLYRLGASVVIEALGLDEMRTEGGGVVAVEWADRSPALLADATIRVDLAHLDAESRSIRITFQDPARQASFARAVSA